MAETLLERRLVRERAARAEAERLLETKSAELYAASEELRSTAQQLAIQSSQLAAIFNNALTGFFLVDPSKSIIRANAYAHRVLGYEPGELPGVNLQDVFDTKYIRSVQALGFERTKLSDQTGDEVNAITKLGTVLPLEISVSEIFLEKQRCTLWIFHDITCRKKTEAERKIMEEELRQAQKLEGLGILASGIAHEINTPVQFIGDNLSFLQEAFEDLYAAFRQGGSPDEGPGGGAQSSEDEPCPGDEDDSDYLLAEVPQAIEQSLEGVGRIAEIVAAVREFSHPGAKEKTPLDVNKAIASTITLSTNHWKYVADIETDFDADLPEVHCVPGQFNQVVLNLVVNAAQAIEELQRDQKGKIVLSTALVGDEVEVCVRDNGGGIPKDIQDKIFDPFFTTKDVGKGTGQGLSLVHSIVVKKHDGRIFFETSSEKGTAFFLRWPVVPREEVPAKARGSR